MTGPLSGSCSCQTIRYRLTAAPMFTHCCHCLDCQRQTGSAFAINALIEAAHVELLAGKPRPVSMPTDSGRPHDIYRCPTCAVALWSDYGCRKSLLFVRVATLDEPHAIAPDVHIFTRSQVPWVKLAKTKGSATHRPARVFKVYYDMKKEWPAASLARRAALKL